MKVDEHEGGLLAHLHGPDAETSEPATPTSVEEVPDHYRRLLLLGWVAVGLSPRVQACLTERGLVGGRPSARSSSCCCRKLCIQAGAALNCAAKSRRRLNL